MAKATEIVLLCEDKRHEQFARAFLRGFCPKIHRNRIRTRIPPPVGDASQWVMQQYPQELKAYRSRANHMNVMLVVIVDADNLSTQARSDDLDSACLSAEVAIRWDKERVVYIIPKWAIETWILALAGNALDENKQITMTHKAKAQKQTTAMAQLLAELCKTQGQACLPASLVSACREFERISPCL